MRIGGLPSCATILWRRYLVLRDDWMIHPKSSSCWHGVKAVVWDGVDLRLSLYHTIPYHEA